MPELDPQVEAVLRSDEGKDPPQSIEDARADWSAGALRFAGEPEEVASVREVEVADGVRMRLYEPEGARGALLYIHGGGWVLGTIDGYDPLCRALANRAQVTVGAVDYRLAPESPFPGPLEDCEAALRALAEQVPGPLAIAGDSAGGNLAAVVARRARDAGGPPLRFQLLVYPVTDAALATGSMKDFGADDRYGLSRASMQACWDAYAPGASSRSPDASPLRAADLAGLPPALVVLAEVDPLADEGSDYAERLHDAGVPAEVAVWPGMIHGFFRWRGAVDAAHEALDEAAAALREALEN